MFRKTILALAAVGSLGTAALVPTSASAHWFGYGPRHFWGGPHFYFSGYGYGGCLRERLVETPWGPRVRTVNVCAY